MLNILKVTGGVNVAIKNTGSKLEISSSSDFSVTQNPATPLILEINDVCHDAPHTNYTRSVFEFRGSNFVRTRPYLNENTNYSFAQTYNLRKFSKILVDGSSCVTISDVIADECDIIISGNRSNCTLSELLCKKMIVNISDSAEFCAKSLCADNLKMFVGKELGDESKCTILNSSITTIMVSANGISRVLIKTSTISELSANANDISSIELEECCVNKITEKIGSVKLNASSTKFNSPVGVLKEQKDEKCTITNLKKYIEQVAQYKYNAMKKSNSDALIMCSDGICAHTIINGIPHNENMTINPIKRCIYIQRCAGCTIKTYSDGTIETTHN